MRNPQTARGLLGSAGAALAGVRFLSGTGSASLLDVATLVTKIRSEGGINEMAAFPDLCLDGTAWADERDALHSAVRRGHDLIDARAAVLEASRKLCSAPCRS